MLMFVAIACYCHLFKIDIHWSNRTIVLRGWGRDKRADGTDYYYTCRSDEAKVDYPIHMYRKVLKS